MRVVLGGYVPAEGRVSMMRTAHSIARHVNALPDLDIAVSLYEGAGQDHVQASRNSGWVRIEKRFLAPARMAVHRADVIHLIDSDHAYGIAPWNRARTVVTCHDLMPFLLDPTLDTIFPGRMGRYFFQRALENLGRCAHVACVSAFTRRTLLEYSTCIPERTSVIPQAVETHFRPLDPAEETLRAFREQHGLEGKRVLLHVGGCFAYKNIRGLLEVAQRVRAAHGNDVVLLKVGGTFSEPDKDFIATAGLREVLVHRVGLSEEELVLAYNAADALVWPSHFEGFGLPVLEAMACGTPVLCSDGGAVPEVAGDAARIHPPEDVDGMAASCLEVLEDRTVAESLRDSGLARAQTFTWERAARAYAAVYGGVAGERT